LDPKTISAPIRVANELNVVFFTKSLLFKTVKFIMFLIQFYNIL
jgi:hypothetical protein